MPKHIVDMSKDVFEVQFCICPLNAKTICVKKAKQGNDIIRLDGLFSLERIQLA